MMKHFVKTSVATAVVLGATLAATGAFASIAGSIVNTRHNMGSTGQGPNTAGATDTAEICIFCHTPHGGSTTDANGNTVAVPLWNKVLTIPGNFKTYDQLGTSTLDAAVGSVGSISLACLTCHDGTQAIDNIINAPGSGGYDSTGGGVDGLDWNWSTDGTLDPVTGRFVGSVDGGGNNIWAIGTDLTNDHPVSMQYGGGGYSTSFPNGGAFGGLSATRDMDFVAAVNIAGTDRWYIENTEMADGTATAESQNGVLDKWDLKLYTRNTATEVASPNSSFTGEMEPFVECGSCHDPHFQTTTFLRMQGLTDLTTDLNTVGPSPDAGSAQSNRGSRLCLACHAK